MVANVDEVLDQCDEYIQNYPSTSVDAVIRLFCIGVDESAAELLRENILQLMWINHRLKLISVDPCDSD